VSSTDRAKNESRKSVLRPPSWTESGNEGEVAALPRILSETVNSLSVGDSGAPWHALLSADDRRRLIHVVRRRGSRPPLDLDMARDLVAAVLPQALVAIADGLDAQRRLVEVIARSLLDDPQSARRLEGLVDAIQKEHGDQAGATA
jgi:hypothetical protein